jgi:hypothetical protein
MRGPRGRPSLARRRRCAVPAMWWHGIGSGLEGSITGRFAGGPVWASHATPCIHSTGQIMPVVGCAGWGRHWQCRRAPEPDRHATPLCCLYLHACMHRVWSGHFTDLSRRAGHWENREGRHGLTRPHYSELTQTLNVPPFRLYSSTACSIRYS